MCATLFRTNAYQAVYSQTMLSSAIYWSVVKITSGASKIMTKNSRFRLACAVMSDPASIGY